MQMNKLRFKDGVGDPRGFTAFLDAKKLPRTLIPRYRGNRLHVLFKTCEIFITHHKALVEFMLTSTSAEAVRSFILADFRGPVVAAEFVALAALGQAANWSMDVPLLHISS